jgi:D-3-phosphoglycerate dehydrogenase
VGIITSTRLDIDKAFINASPFLRWIGRMGSGMEVIDVDYATGRNINCYSSPEGNRNAVAEHTLGMLLSLNKRIVKSHNEIREGKWLRDENRGTELEGKTIGIIGLGYMGKEFARKLSVFDMRILAYDKYNNADFPEYVKRCEELDSIYNDADIISFHVPLQDDTMHYFNASFLEKMKKPFVLVNSSRGAVVSTKALRDGLLAGKITGACLDVAEEEPLDKMSVEMRNAFNEILKMPNVIVTPHIAGYSYEALYKMSVTLLDKIVIGAQQIVS